MALEDAAALGILFNKDYFKGDVQDSLAVYEKVRLPRATKVQASAAKAAYNINERIGEPASYMQSFHVANVHRLLQQYIVLKLQSRGREEETDH